MLQNVCDEFCVQFQTHLTMFVLASKVINIYNLLLHCCNIFKSPVICISNHCGMKSTSQSCNSVTETYFCLFSKEPLHLLSSLVPLIFTCRRPCSHFSLLEIISMSISPDDSFRRSGFVSLLRKKTGETSERLMANVPPQGYAVPEVRK